MPKSILKDMAGTNYLLYWCEGCGHIHHVPAERWSFNGNVDSPTISPSVRHFYTHPETKAEKTVCHYFIRDGVMQFCSDSPHKLAGQNAPLKSFKIIEEKGYTEYMLEDPLA